jgi:hypothetical protein
VRLLSFTIILVSLLVASAAPAQDSPKPGPEAPLRKVAFFDHTDDPPRESAAWFDDVVLAPERAPAGLVTALRAARVTVVATLAATADNARAADATVARLTREGYAGFLIDGRGSAATAPAANTLFASVHKNAPFARLLWRCPDNFAPPVPNALAAIVIDDHFTTTRPDGGRVPRPLGDVQKRAAALRKSYVDRGIAVIAVESLGRDRRPEARVLAETLALARISPWIEIAGSRLGVGLVEPVPRRVLGLYNNADDDFLPFSLLHRMAALPLEYLGYAIEYRDIKQGLPEGDLSDRYAGIVSWFTGPLTYPLDYSNWLVQQIDRGMHVAILGILGASPTPPLLQRLGVTAGRRALVGPATLVRQDGLSGFEAPQLPLVRGVPSWSATGKNDVRHVEIKDAEGQVANPVATGRWGGYAFDPYLLEAGHRFAYRWRIDPFAFFRRALDLPPLPVPDPSTENGRRLLMIQIDGDGFNGRSALPGRSFSGEVILRDFLQIYRLPTTVSFVEGEIGPSGLNPNLTEKLEPIAREIARLPHVELASHTYSHPFDWPHPVPQSSRPARATREPHLPIRGYKYSPAREVRGSVNYLNDRIAPPGKRVKAILWSGNALPDEDVIKEADAIEIWNINGVNCDEPYDAPSLTQVPSFYRPVGKGLQVYAPAHNENVYIESSRLGDQLSGFRNIVKMFEFTETPRRLKPIDIYYHFYSGASLSGSNALRDVYLWAVKQETLAVPLSAYAAKVDEYPRVRAARALDGSWEFRGMRALRTLRIDDRAGWPDLVRSVNVIGVRDTPQGRHVALGPGDKVVLAFQPNPPGEPHLMSANAPVIAWVRTATGLKFHLQGPLPVSMTIAACLADETSGADKSSGSGVTIELDRARHLTRLHFASADTGDVEVLCK